MDGKVRLWGNRVLVVAALLSLSLFAGGCARAAHRYAGPGGPVPDISPLPYPSSTVISRFGDGRGRGRSHKGIDLKAPKGSTVIATADGRVEFTGRQGGYGRLVLIDHGEGWATAYGHLKRCKTKAGKRVRRGDVIGKVGASGNATTSHLHYEVRRHGQAVDPARYLP